jgi:hypothetical protein
MKSMKLCFNKKDRSILTINNMIKTTWIVGQIIKKLLWLFQIIKVNKFHKYLKSETI